MKTLLLILALFIGTCAAQQTCPVEIRNAKVYTTKGLDRLLINYKNISNKKITGTKFAIAEVDAVGDVHPDWLEYVSSLKLNPNQHKETEWNWIGYSTRNTNAAVVKVMFEDGSTWQDDGSHSCSFTKMR